jgi:hypothetical protein
MKNTELEMYKGFFDRVENIIKDNKEISDKEKFVIIFIELENMIRYQHCGVSNEVHDFIQKLRNNTENKILVKNYLEYLDAKYPNESSSNWNSTFVYMKAEEESKFFISLIRKIIESSSEISDEDNIYVRRFFDLLVNEYLDKLQEEKYPPKPKYSAEHAFDVIRTLNCSLEDKLKIAELFEYTE